VVAFSVEPGTTSGVPTVQHGAVWPIAQLVWLMQLLVHSELVEDPADDRHGQPGPVVPGPAGDIQVAPGLLT